MAYDLRKIGWIGKNDSVGDDVGFIAAASLIRNISVALRAGFLRLTALRVARDLPTDPARRALFFIATADASTASCGERPWTCERA